MDKKNVRFKRIPSDIPATLGFKLFKVLTDELGGHNYSMIDAVSTGASIISLLFLQFMSVSMLKGHVPFDHWNDCLDDHLSGFNKVAQNKEFRDITFKAAHVLCGVTKKASGA